MEDLKRQLAIERETYQKQYPALTPDEGSGVDADISTEQVEKALNFKCNWGKYKGSSYREIYIKDPTYFQRTVLGNLSRINNQSFSYRALSTLSNSKPSVLPVNQDLGQKENNVPPEPLPLVRTPSRANLQLSSQK